MATTCPDVKHQMAFERLERNIHQVIPAKRNLFNKLFQCHERQQLQEVGTRATSPSRKFAKELVIMKSAAEDETYRAANMTTYKQLQFQIHLADAETEVTTWS